MNCPECGEPMEREGPMRAEPDVGLVAFPGGWACPECGELVEEDPNDD